MEEYIETQEEEGLIQSYITYKNDRAGLGIKQANKIEIPTLCGKASLYSQCVKFWGNRLAVWG